MSFTYKGLSAQYSRHIVTDEEVDRQLKRLQEQTPRIALADDRPTKLGDEVVLDYAGFCDGVQFPGGTAEMQTLVLGSGMFIPGFEEQLLDKVPGEQVSVQVTFPKEYHAPDLAGKAAEFRCVIHQIRVKSAYELDDVFAKEVGGCDTFDEMWEKMRQSMQQLSDERGEMDLQDRLLRQAAQTLEFEPTKEQLDVAVDELMDHLRAQLAQQQLSLENYCAFMNTTVDKLREDFLPSATGHVKAQATVELIVELEGLAPTKEEIGEALAVVCRQNHMTLEEIKPYYDAELEAAIVRSVLTGKVMRLIRDAAHIAEV